MSLAEELLADLEEEEEEEEIAEAAEASANDGGGIAGEMELSVSDGTKMDVDGGEAAAKDDTSGNTLEAVVKYYDSEELASVMHRIDSFSATARTAKDISGPVEADPEYQLIVEANNLAAELDDEISNVHKFAKERYNVRFPELETLVVQPLEYLMTAKELGNNVLKAKNNKVLEQYLTQATIMVVSVTASTTQGTELSQEELDTVGRACDMVVTINDTKQKIFAYVESRMAFIAPNMSTIIGASTAAKLMGAAGGLTNLSKMPSANVHLLGQQKKTLAGFSQKSTMPHTGFIYWSEVVQAVPPDLRRKVARIVSNKCTLAARVDAQHEASDGHVGQEYREEIEKKIDKFQEPPPVKAVRSLPAPIDAPQKKRGGRRVRRQKERYAVTELRKQANRMNFGELEEDVYQSDLGVSRGNIGKGGVGGGIRSAQIDDKTKVRISQTLKKNLQKQQATWGGATTSIKKHVSGTASSVAFTPLQGLEIVNPNAAESGMDTETQKYFSSSGAFLKVKTPAPK